MDNRKWFTCYDIVEWNLQLDWKLHKLRCDDIASNFRYWYHDDCERKRYQNGASHDWIVKPDYSHGLSINVNVY